MSSTKNQLSVSQKNPHPKQIEILESTAKRKVICTGRRFGKTTLAAWYHAELAMRGYRTLFAAPQNEQIQYFWDESKRLFGELLDTDLVYKNEQQHLIKLNWALPGYPPGGVIKAKTAWDAESMRGDYADHFTFEEYALMDPAAWTEVGAPMLLDNDGTAWFISTPKRRNHFYHLYLKCSTSDRWESFHGTSFDNPHLSEEALEEITEDMTESAYRQEILAEFIESEGMVFRNIEDVMVAPINPSPSEHRKHRLVMGVDWGQSTDFTAISIGCATCKEEVMLYRSKNREYAYQRDRIKGWHDRWKLASILAESNSMGQPNIEEMYREGLPVEGFATTASSKPPLIEGLQLAIEKREWKFLPDKIARTELEAYEVEYNKHGRPSYSAPSGIHDDTVIARALMVREANKAGPSIAFA